MTDPGKFNYGCKVRWEMDSANCNISLAASSGHAQLWPNSSEWLTGSQEPSVPRQAEISYSCYQKDQGLLYCKVSVQHTNKHHKLSVKLFQASWKACANEQFVFTFSSSCKPSPNVNLHCHKPVWIQATPAKYRARQKERERLGCSVLRTWPWEAVSRLPLLATGPSERSSFYKTESQMPQSWQHSGVPTQNHCLGNGIASVAQAETHFSEFQPLAPTLMNIEIIIPLSN